jgi:tRNA-Thr(GGU) m(6)t(6)A37 methyltransferase TsaA
LADFFQIFPVGVVKKKEEKVTIEVYEGYRDALLGLEQFSHIIVLSWFHQNDTPEKRRILQVHPRGDKALPLTGVFGTRSPVRPNVIALSTCEILSIDRNIIRIDKIDAFDGTPVIDIKPCIGKDNSMINVRVPEWVDK